MAPGPEHDVVKSCIEAEAFGPQDNISSHCDIDKVDSHEVVPEPTHQIMFDDILEIDPSFAGVPAPDLCEEETLLHHSDSCLGSHSLVNVAQDPMHNAAHIMQDSGYCAKSNDVHNNHPQMTSSQPSQVGYFSDVPDIEITGASNENVPMTENVCDLPKPSDDACVFDDPLPPVPPDGGYGWVIVFCGFMVNLLVDGMCYMGGILYIELLDHFQQPKAKTQWIHTLVPPVYLMTGPFVGALVNKFGCRLITIVGSLIAAVFFIVSSFMPNVESLIFTYGIMIGIGFGCMYLPAVCFVSYYFDRRRAMATGISVCGSGMGTFIFPPFMNFLLGKYGWRGSLLILSGLSLNCCVFGALMRPLEATKPKQLKLIPRDEKKKIKKKKLEDEKAVVMKSIIMQKIIEQKKRNRTVSNGSLDGAVITGANTLVKDPVLLKTILIAETQNKLEKTAFNSSAPDLRHSPSDHKQQTVHDICNSRSLQTSRTGLDAETIQPVAMNVINRYIHQVSERHKCASQTSTNGLAPPRVGVAQSMEAIQRKRKDMSRIMYRKDIFYSGSVTSIAEYKSNPNINVYTQSVLSLPAETPDKTGACAPFTNILLQMFDLSLFKSVTFIILISNAFFSFLGFFVPFMFIPDLARINGASAGQAAMLISVLGLCNTVGRVVAGWLADRPWSDSLVIQNVALITGGVATAVVPLLNSYALLCAYCSVFGTCMAMFIALRSIVTAEMMGVQKLNNAFGLTIFFQGVAGAAGSPLAGTIFDATGSYMVSFLIAGLFITFSGIICLPLRRIANWENAKSSKNGTIYHMVGDDLPLPEIDIEITPPVGKGVQFDDDVPLPREELEMTPRVTNGVQFGDDLPQTGIELATPTPRSPTSASGSRGVQFHEDNETNNSIS